jgi:tetratricopeptide (TPR) repeat protein
MDEAVRLGLGDASLQVARGDILSAREDDDKALAAYAEAIRIEPKNATAHYHRATLRIKKADYVAAHDDLSAALRLDPNDRLIQHAMARFLLTCPDPKLRNAQRAIEAATRACELTSWKVADELETLAASHAEAGHFDEAVKQQEVAIRLTPDDHPSQPTRDAHLKLYKAKRPS